jgi:hypothetical protein
MNNDYKHIHCHLVLIAADALAPDQLQRKRDNQNGLAPLSDETIEQILDAWRTKLKRESTKHAGYFVFGYDA